MQVLGISGPKYALIEVDDDPAAFDEKRSRQLHVVRRGQGRPLRLVVEDSQALLVGAIDGKLRIVAQADDPESPLLLIEDVPFDQPPPTADPEASGQSPGDQP